MYQPMPSTPYYTVTEESINHLISFLDERDDWQTPHKYTILEWFGSPNGIKEPVVYELYNLTMELEQGVVICSDLDEILWNEPHTIHNFLLKDIDMIQYNSDYDYITITLFGENYNGYIRIYY